MKIDLEGFVNYMEVVKDMSYKELIKYCRSLPKGVYTRYKIRQFDKLGIKNQPLFPDKKD